MLKYFTEHTELEQVKSIFVALNRTKDRLQRGKYSAPWQDFDECKHLFDDIKALAIQKNDERLANAQFVFKEYFLLFCALCRYNEMLKTKEYKASWDKLQDCFDIIKCVGRFTDEGNRYELPTLYNLLLEYETLYPYKVFCSSEFIIEEATCSICGKSVLGLDCPHIQGELYWGEPAVHEIKKIKEVQGVALVSHPENKRCIIQTADENISDEERFKKLDNFVELNLPFLQMFSISCKIEKRTNDEYKGIERNDHCPCGSGKKFKKCCYSKLYYDHYRYIVTPKDKIQLHYFT